MHLSLRTAQALLGVCVALLLLLLVSSSALAAGPATVTVRVEGLSETKLPSTTVTTTTTPVVKDGNSAHACPGTSALGALELATSGNWSGPWNSSFGQYEILTIEGETHLFEPLSQANYFWSLWVDEKESEVGACEAQLGPGDRVLLFPSCFGSECPPPASPLTVEAPASASVGESVTVLVRRFKSNGEGEPAAGASVSGGAVPVLTDAGGRAHVTFASAGTATLRVTAPQSVRTEAGVCVHNGNDGTCGTSAPASTQSSGAVAGAVASKPYTGPYALVASVRHLGDGKVYPPAHAPRLIEGTVLGHSPVTSVELKLRRGFRGRCYAFDATRARFRRAACGTGSFFKVSSTAAFSYLLPSALPRGRYVLDIEGTDAAGNHTTLARGSTRLVFYVG
jgi:hypothetical protein